MARMIYHVPYPLNPEGKSGSALRPMRMLEAFREVGYEVELVSGESKQRRGLIKALKARIAHGERFDFVYSESHTMPTALTDPDHLPRHPLMDVAFLRFCRRNGIKVGLFYRDIYWRFPDYKKGLNPLVHTGTRLLYNFDLLAYKFAVDKLYLPSMGMGKFVPHFPAKKHEALPPGGEINDAGHPGDNSVRLFYVGGLGSYYNLHDCVRAVAASKNAFLTICTREDEWRQVQAGYEPLINDRIEIVHKHGSDLVPYYATSDICMLFIEPSIYRSFAAPIKFAEYIGFGKPVIVNEGTNVAEFVKANGNGWAIPFDQEALTTLLDDLAENPEKIAHVTDTALRIRADNTWAARARQVARQLT
ncbi:glycosyltransferase family 4 protein [Arthrobacter sp. N199823]|uniref:glycosyltransferase family 4 protein n=1 Tax=Arthrobacter sp. N199823 TaxID=2058895 RepID=UPI000CE50896|nr:glycosyltransferase family 4 protein [Arthrobacter sp. N199823]